MSTLTTDPSLAWLDAVMTDVDPSQALLDALSTADSFSGRSSPVLAASPDGGSQASASTSSHPTSSSRTSSTRVASSSKSRSISHAPRRRIRPKIALDPSQPLTAQGKPRARVYVACNQCRTRKTRCDGGKPVCFNCRKRPPEVGECSYDPQPKRRGQDKVPGTRIRSASERAKKRTRQSTTDHEHSDSDHPCSRPADDNASSHPHLPQDDSLSTPSDGEYDPFPLVDLDPPSADVEVHIGRYKMTELAIPTRPSLQFTRDTWWEALLTFYAAEDGAKDVDASTLSPDQRTSAVQSIVSDLRALFHSSVYWLSFIHLPKFFDGILNPTRRASVQPSLVLSALALGKFALSSEAEQGARGRAKALKLLDLALGSLQASLASGWVDLGLIQAAWLMVYFELQSHPAASIERGRSSLLLLDSLIRLFSLSTLDADLKPSRGYLRFAHPANNRLFPRTQHTPNPSHPVSTTMPGFFQTGTNTPFDPTFSFSAASVPPTDPLHPENLAPVPPASSHHPACGCVTMSLGHQFPAIRDIAPSWGSTIGWPENLSEGEFRKEECRRLIWASLGVTASMNSYTSIYDKVENNYLWIKDPDNYAILFPEEVLAVTKGQALPADNLWSMYIRATLLFHACVRTRGDRTLTAAQRAEFSMQAWHEIDALEEALDGHTCQLNRHMGFQAHEMLFSARMCVSHEFQRYVPQVSSNGSQLFYRDKAEAWLKHRAEMAERVWRNLRAGIPNPANDFRKPLLIYWFMSHVIKALALWRVDPTFTLALEASKSFTRRLEYLMMFWPSDTQRREWQKLRYQLVEACMQSGIAPPEPDLPSRIPISLTPQGWQK